jgi:hypothetical protein
MLTAYNYDTDSEDEASSISQAHLIPYKEEQQNTTPPLVQLLRSSDWSEALNRLRSHPQEAKWIGKDGETPLHAAFVDCTEHVPLSILLGVTSASCDAQILSRYMGNCTVLDYILLSLCDLMRMDHRIPLYEYRLRFQVIYKLISMDSNVIGKDTLKYLFHLGKLWIKLPRDGSNFDDGSNKVLRSKDSLGYQTRFLFSLMDLILYVEQHKQVRSSDEVPFENFINRLIMVRVRYDYPPAILFLALEVYGRTRCSDYDQYGRTPLLHTILSEKSFQYVKDSVFLIRKILQISPGNASLPHNMYLFPLHLAIDRKFQWNTGIASIALDYPNVLTIKDPRSLLLPFMQAAASGSSLDTVFELLRMNPCAAFGH